MSRRDDYLDAMLRHLGAAYYESLHGRAGRSDVARALDTVEEHLNEHGERSEAAPPEPGPQPAGHGSRPSRWARRVGDVMTTSVVTVDRITPYQEIARLLTERKIGGVPVLMMGRQVAGVVTESDLLAAEDKAARDARLDAETPGRWRLHKPQLAALTAGTLMSTPAVTIRPDATIPAAARMMNTHGIGRLPVVDSKGKLAGIVSRRDLLSVFLRPDADVARDVGQILEELPLVDPEGIVVRVRHGVVNLSGPVESSSLRQRDLIAVVLRLVWDVDGVVDVVNRLGEATESKPRSTA
jgi:CBS domain-containing protein